MFNRNLQTLSVGGHQRSPILDKPERIAVLGVQKMYSYSIIEIESNRNLSRSFLSACSINQRFKILKLNFKL